MTVAVLPRPAVHRIACAVVATELRRLRETELPQPAPGAWSEDQPLDEEGLGLDSIERLGALGALAEAFDLDDTLLKREAAGTVGAWIDWIMLGHGSGNGRLVVRTSGSTGAPRLCAHAVADLLAEAAFLATRFTGRRRVVSLVPADHLYGIVWTALLPSALDIPVVARAIGAPLCLAPGDLVVAVPDQWRAMLRLMRGFPEDVVGVSSAGPLDGELAADVLAAGIGRLVDIYGSSETGGIAMRDVPATAYQLLPRWHLSPDGNGDWHLRDDNGEDHALPDHIERLGERGIRPIGRRDGAVQVAGHNVWPDQVARVLRDIDGVADAAVRLHVNGRLKAFIVPHGDWDLAALSARIEQGVGTRLTDPERPRSLRFGTALPRNAMGKLKDWA